MRAAAVVGCFHELISMCLLGSADPDQTDPRGTVSSGSTLFAIIICDRTTCCCIPLIAFSSRRVQRWAR